MAARTLGRDRHRRRLVRVVSSVADSAIGRALGQGCTDIETFNVTSCRSTERTQRGRRSPECRQQRRRCSRDIFDLHFRNERARALIYYTVDTSCPDVNYVPDNSSAPLVVLHSYANTPRPRGKSTRDRSSRASLSLSPPLSPLSLSLLRFHFFPFSRALFCTRSHCIMPATRHRTATPSRAPAVAGGFLKSRA